MDLSQRNHILPFEPLTRPYALLVVLLQSALAQMFDDRDEDVLGVVFLKSEVRVAVMGDLRRVGGAEHFRMADLISHPLFLLYLFPS